MIEHQRLQLDDEIIRFYLSLVRKIAGPGDDLHNYGETAKIDVENVLLINERICGVGPQVARLKIEIDPSLLEISDKAELTRLLRNTAREDDIVKAAKKFTKRHRLLNDQVVDGAFRKIMELTVIAEVAYVLQVQTKIASDTQGVLKVKGFEYGGPGFATRKVKRRGAVGWGNHPSNFSGL